MADELRLPRKVNGVWEPYNPSEWRAYASRQRWFRTPNDAFMTGNFHVSQSLLQKALKTQSLSWVQLLLASVYSGAFHPTAEGPGGDRRCGGRPGARRARQVRDAPARGQRVDWAARRGLRP